MPGSHSSSFVIPYELWERAKKQGIVINQIVRDAIEAEVEKREKENDGGETGTGPKA
jgi:post-segregation antitoxin (ccd killing protein)